MGDDPKVVTADGFRSDGASALEWVARYLEGLDQVAVSPSVAPGDVAARLPAHAPEEPEPFDAILGDLDRVVVPGLTHWQAPGFFAYFPAGSSPPSVLGELVSAGLAVNGMPGSSESASRRTSGSPSAHRPPRLTLPRSRRSGDRRARGGQRE